MSSSNITITDEQIAEIANRMADEGQNVSPLAIWSEVHTGSVVAVAASLRKWREARTPRATQVVERPALPESVTDTMRDALDRLWSSAQDEAERSVTRRLAALRQRVEDACNERDDALAELQSTVQELDSLQVELDKISTAYESKIDADSGMDEDLATAMLRADTAEKRATELTERVSTLEAELESATAELASAREAAAAHEAAEVARVEEIAAAPVQPEVDVAALEAEHSEAVARLEGEIEAIRAALQAEQEAHAAQRDEAAGAQAERDAAASKLESAEAQLASLSEERDADASEIARLSASLSEAQKRAEELAEGAALSAPTEEVEFAAPAAPAADNSEEIETLKAQLARETETHAAAIAEARETVKKWSEYANGLKQQLAQANEKALVALARGAGEAALSRRLSTELGQVVPEHEMLRKDAQQQVIVDAINAQLEQQGYRYDAKTGSVSKLSAENASA